MRRNNILSEYLDSILDEAPQEIRRALAVKIRRFIKMRSTQPNQTGNVVIADEILGHKQPK